MPIGEGHLQILRRRESPREENTCIEGRTLCSEVLDQTVHSGVLLLGKAPLGSLLLDDISGVVVLEAKYHQVAHHP